MPCMHLHLCISVYVFQCVCVVVFLFVLIAVKCFHIVATPGFFICFSITGCLDFFFILLTLRMMLYQTSVSMSPCAHMPLFMVGAFKILIDTAKIQSTIFQQMLEKLFANQTMAFV